MAEPIRVSINGIEIAKSLSTVILSTLAGMPDEDLADKVMITVLVSMLTFCVKDMTREDAQQFMIKICKLVSDGAEAVNKMEEEDDDE